jgi:hypothetical protein
VTEDLQAKYANKINKLLRKAESTTPEEAEALLEAAERLMAKWAIDEAMLAQARGDVDEKIVERTTVYNGVYHMARFDIGAAVGRAQDVKVLIGRGPKTTTLYLVGFESDVERAIMLDASVQIQAQAALERWARTGIQAWMSASEKYKARREFLFGFARGVEHKLALAKKAGHEELRAERVAAGADATEVAAGMELVIRSRKDRVEDWYDRTYGATRPVSRSYASGGSGARAAGSFAGRNADVGSGGRLGSRRALPGGS